MENIQQLKLTIFNNITDRDNEIFKIFEVCRSDYKNIA